MALKLLILSSFLILLFVVDSSVGVVPNVITSSPFHFLNQLKGCHKGDKTRGINQLKTYLQEFGYLDRNPTQSNDDNFDDTLESAIKTYQQNYRIAPTGALDTETVSKMMAPRCGVPDIIDGTNTMQPEKRSSTRSSSSSIHTVSHYSFFPGSPRWPASKRKLTYKFLSNVPTDARVPVNRAFQKWANATKYFRFALVPSKKTSDLSVGFYSGSHGDGYAFDGFGGTLAHAFAPTTGMFHYDADEPWSVGPVAGYFDLETVAVHEIGHLLGLGHSSVESAIMYPSISPGEIKNIARDDVQGIKALYDV